MAQDTDAELLQLQQSGCSVLPSDIPGLQPDQTENMPNVLNLQQRYARLPGSSHATAFTGSIITHAPLPPHQQQVQVEVTFDLVQAPSAFALPVMQKKAFDPPFQVRMTWRSQLPLQFNATVAAFVLDEQAVANMLSWQVPTAEGTGRTQPQLLDNQQERMVVLAPEGPSPSAPAAPGAAAVAAAVAAAAGAGPGAAAGSPHQDTLGGRGSGSSGSGAGGQWHYFDALFTFNRLQFGQPSSVRPRWLVFVGSLVGGGCVYTHLKVPTVVMSRLKEQFDKAKRLLWGSVEPACNTTVMRMDYRQLRRDIKRQLVAKNIHREPSEEDYRYLGTKAGFVVAAEGVGRGAAAGGGAATLEELAAFQEWFEKHVRMLKHLRTQYERTDPQVICGFGVTREHAEAMLAQHPQGTFLLRFGSQGGQLVLSVRAGRTSHGSVASSSSNGASRSCIHYMFNIKDIQMNGLESLLERNNTALELLDASTGRRHLRTDVLDRAYLQATVVLEARKRIRQPSAEEPCLSQASGGMLASPTASQQQTSSDGAPAPMPCNASPQQHPHHLRAQSMSPQQREQPRQQQPPVLPPLLWQLPGQSAFLGGGGGGGGSSGMQLDYGGGGSLSWEAPAASGLPGATVPQMGESNGGAAGGGTLRPDLPAGLPGLTGSLCPSVGPPLMNSLSSAGMMMPPAQSGLLGMIPSLPMGAGMTYAWPTAEQRQRQQQQQTQPQPMQAMALDSLPMRWNGAAFGMSFLPPPCVGGGSSVPEQPIEAAAAAPAARAAGQMAPQPFLPVLGSSSGAAGPPSVMAASLSSPAGNTPDNSATEGSHSDAAGTAAAPAAAAAAAAAAPAAGDGGASMGPAAGASKQLQLKQERGDGGDGAGFISIHVQTDLGASNVGNGGARARATNGANGSAGLLPAGAGGGGHVPLTLPLPPIPPLAPGGGGGHGQQVSSLLLPQLWDIKPQTQQAHQQSEQLAKQLQGIFKGQPPLGGAGAGRAGVCPENPAAAAVNAQPAGPGAAEGNPAAASTEDFVAKCFN